ncbi:hypothetical protein RRG08_031276 [Elysia crispata]|uniref:Uncharacterized protein n=1 Tax=Elysia crispata TaxID=231223 RepID=A0AAE1AJH4_9GAST|nr:hypothetical protein RRG08_031276 [Elysia crispata]
MNYFEFCALDLSLYNAAESKNVPNLQLRSLRAKLPAEILARHVNSATAQRLLSVTSN